MVDTWSDVIGRRPGHPRRCAARKFEARAYRIILFRKGGGAGATGWPTSQSAGVDERPVDGRA
jgi:hypothetical protein